MAPKIERLLENFILGEGPHWDDREQVLYFVDIIGHSIHRYDPRTTQHTKAVFEESVSFIIPIEGTSDEFLISLRGKVAKIVWDGVSEEVSDIKELARFESGDNVQFNDGKADPVGRLWAGSMGFIEQETRIVPGQGSFYSFSDGKLETHFGNVDISNGLAWNHSGDKFYYIDSHKKTVDQFDYDSEAGTIANRKPIFTLLRHDIPGVPDGMTIDSDGNLWVAIAAGSRVIKIDPRKPETLLQTVELPAKLVTSVAFGGPDLTDLYVTTGSFPFEGGDYPPPLNGAIYRVTNLNAKGVEATLIRL